MLFAVGLSLLLSGCVSQPIGPLDPAAALAPVPLLQSIEQFKILPGEAMWLESFDGTRLFMRVFRPDAPADWQAPVILVSSPYFTPDSRSDPDDPVSLPGYERYQWLVQEFVPRGYAVVFQDVRGTGESGGCLEQTGPKQMKDQYLVIEHLATRSWTNGKLGMFGKSYDGETQQSAAIMAPPHLTTIIPLSSVAGQYDWNFYAGVPYSINGLAGMASYAQIGLTPGSTVEGKMNFPSRADCHGENFEQGADPRGDFNRFWQDRELRSGVKNVKASVFYVHGLADWNVKPIHIAGWFNEIDSPKTAWLGQWAHDYPELNTNNKEWNRTDWRPAVEAWYDHWLMGLENGVSDRLGVVEIQDNLGAWRNASSFPDLDATPFELHFAPGGRLSSSPTAAKSTASYSEKTAEWPAAVAGEAYASTSFVEFESAPLKEDLRYSGQPTAKAYLSFDKPDAHIVVHLLDDGKVVNRGYLSAQHRDSVKEGRPVPMDTLLDYTVSLYPQEYVFAKGHKIGVRMMGVDDWVQPTGAGESATLAFGGDVLSGLILPLVTNEDLEELGRELE
ncbi:MAG: CocE/NonD family hydrolase [Euryarchaeota archaeon]|nr:CocE/NonD family hydrolase [Euryarchaeota archaeon]